MTGAVSEDGQGSELGTLTVPSGRVPSCTHNLKLSQTLQTAGAATHMSARSLTKQIPTGPGPGDLKIKCLLAGDTLQWGAETAS